MRNQRAKKYRKAMAIYQTSFNFREPYQVLLSSDFILAAHRFKMDLASLLQKTLQAPLKLMITQCCIAELYTTKEQAPIALAKTCERRRCGHIPDPIPSHKCLTSCLDISGENKHRYILATQDAELRAAMRQIPGVPLIYIKRAVMVMEPISPATLAKRDILERSKLGGMERLGKRKQRDEDDDEEKPKKKKKGPKEPNPLSVKKKKHPDPVSSAIPKGRAVASANDERDSNEKLTPNVIDDPTDSVPRHKSSRRRKHHKKPAQQQEMIPTEPTVQE